MTEYNCYGRPVDRVLDDIQKGDKVEFWYHVTIKEGNRTINKKITIIGNWDGEKVIFNDKYQTVVRNKEWLKLCI